MSTLCTVLQRPEEKRNVFIKKIGLCGDFQSFPFFSSFEQNAYQYYTCVCFNVLCITKSLFLFSLVLVAELGSYNSLQIFFFKTILHPWFPFTLSTILGKSATIFTNAGSPVLFSSVSFCVFIWVVKGRGSSKLPNTVLKKRLITFSI